MDVLYRESRGGEDVHVCIRPDGSGVVIPSWMFDGGRCTSLLLVERAHPSLAALCEARAILDEVRSDRLAIVPNNRSQEPSDDHNKPGEERPSDRASDPPASTSIVVVDVKIRAAVVMALARLLLEAAASGRREGVRDEP